jgi:hypothetical protein
MEIVCHGAVVGYFPMFHFTIKHLLKCTDFGLLDGVVPFPSTKLLMTFTE